MLRPRPVVILSAFALLFLVALALAFDVLPASLQRPRVTLIQPADGAREVLPTAPLTIHFSAPMDRATTEQSIQFEPRARGTYSWRDDQTLTFTPSAGFPVSTTLTVRVAENARSWWGRPLAQAAQARFATLTRPSVVASTPAPDARFLYVPDRVTIRFSRPMNPMSVTENLTLVPPLANQRLEWEDASLNIFGFFAPRTRYQIRIGVDTEDAEHGIALADDWTLDFTTTEQYPNVSILERDRALKLPEQRVLSIPVQFTNVTRLDAALYPLLRAEFEANANAPFERWRTFQPPRAPLETWRVATNAALDQYTRMNLTFAALPAGTYFLNITTPEGPGDSKLLLVETK